ncbi:nucleotide sugar dehydrogenase [Corynebacterium tuberculostearicum]|uniref:nucleotide sugar dehydrogenase n=1 Tax=Corynebacterium tuberculostearicum TaxID=38304 RepID=UPI00293517FE|nr:nucleotide sugar dehydrogenase [Corynebacterium tuberculostearicum]MDV2431447.1 nucleotide sugar dehydrogenase [Corynebacterium tuberculostearicum]
MSGEVQTANYRAELCVVGLGYIGLPTATLFSQKFQQVLGYDIDSEKVETINRGSSPFSETNFEPILADAIRTKSLMASTSLSPADCYIIAVPTPLGEDKKADVSAIESAIRNIATMLRGDELVVIESTSPPKTTQRMRDLLRHLRPELKIDVGADREVSVIYCPERVIPGAMVAEFVANDRIVGGDTSNGRSRGKALYEKLVKGEIFLTDSMTAEMVKLTENTFRDLNIAFANQLSTIADGLDIDVWKLIELANRHPRVNILRPSPGVGGHCIAVDPWFIARDFPESSSLIREARAVNDSKPTWVARKILECYSRRECQEIYIYGLTFKPNVDDLRGSPAVEIVQNIAKRVPEASITVVDPYVKNLPLELGNLENVVLRSEVTEPPDDSLSIFLVAHDDFRVLARSLSGSANVLDFVGIFANLG